MLKDASATAVYGVRGANGVVIVKTKPGKVGKPQFSVDYYESFTRLTKKVDMADAYTYMDARNEAQMNTSGTLKYSAAYIEATKKSNGLLPNDNPRPSTGQITCSTTGDTTVAGILISVGGCLMQTTMLH